MVVIGALDVLFVLLALEVFDIGDSGAGLLNAALGLGVVVGGALTFTVRRAPAPGAGPGDGRAAWRASRSSRSERSASALAAAALIVATGVGFAVCDVVGRTILQRVTPDLVLGRVLGALEGLAFAGLAVGSLARPARRAVASASRARSSLVGPAAAGGDRAVLGRAPRDGPPRARPGARAGAAPRIVDLRAAATAAARAGSPARRAGSPSNPGRC